MEPIPEGVVLPAAKVEFQMGQVGASLSSMLIFTYIILGIAIVLTLGYSIISLVISTKNDPKSAIKTVGMLGAVVVIWLISYMLASSSMPEYYIEKHNLTTGTIKWVDVGLIAAYLLFFIVLGTLIAGNIRNSLLKRQK
jgi:ABC-type Fe3+ transport system permease subunit